jgi:hypothetical protein
MALFSKSKIFLYGGVRQEKPLTTTHYSNDQLILYHLESFNELLKRTWPPAFIKPSPLSC